MKLHLHPHRHQSPLWPKSGRHILAQFDEHSILVYQAYRPAIGNFAVTNGYFGGEVFSFSRMSWIKPNFLWMMYRSGWGTKPDQEMTLGLRLPRTFFDALLAQAVPSSWDRRLYATQEDWADAVQRSDVRLQWDPDHHPSGAALDRRAIQLGLRGEVLQAFAGDGIDGDGATRPLLEVIDLSAFVAEQRQRLADGAELLTPTERAYLPADPAIAERLMLDEFQIPNA